MGVPPCVNPLPWVCPSCLDKNDYRKLTLSGSSAACENGHQFDKAKQGYLNLLLPHKKRSKEPGDDESMMQARREFLSLGHYHFLMEGIAEQIHGYVPEKHINALDIGCGEGSYIAYLSNTFPSINWSGIDISKPAIKKAAASNKTANFAVASGSSIPAGENGFDFTLSVFAPVVNSEVKRVLKAGGTLLRVSPGENHFIELKHAIYNTPKTHDKPTMLDDFSIQNEIHISQQVHLDNTALQLLLAMTPLQWRGDAHKKQELKNLDRFTITFDFFLQVMRCD